MGIQPSEIPKMTKLQQEVLIQIHNEQVKKRIQEREKVLKNIRLIRGSPNVLKGRRG